MRNFSFDLGKREMTLVLNNNILNFVYLLLIIKNLICKLNTRKSRIR